MTGSTVKITQKYFKDEKIPMSSLLSKGGVHSLHVRRNPKVQLFNSAKLAGQNLTIFLLIIFVPLRDRGLV
jgi:hypothetical protein